MIAFRLYTDQPQGIPCLMCVCAVGVVDFSIDDYRFKTKTLIVPCLVAGVAKTFVHDASNVIRLCPQYVGAFWPFTVDETLGIAPRVPIGYIASPPSQFPARTFQALLALFIGRVQGSVGRGDSAQAGIGSACTVNAVSCSPQHVKSLSGS